jgi:hypothetical protein
MPCRWPRWCVSCLKKCAPNRAPRAASGHAWPHSPTSSRSPPANRNRACPLQSRAARSKAARSGLRSSPVLIEKGRRGMGPPEAGRRRQSGASRIDPPTAYGRGADAGEEGFVLGLALLLAGPVGTGIKVLALPPVMRPPRCAGRLARSIAASKTGEGLAVTAALPCVSRRCPRP